MAARPILTLSGALMDATLVQTNLANAVISLFKGGFVPSPSTTKAELEAQECDFDDYVTKTVVSWTGPVLAPVSGYQINAPIQTWVVATNVVTNEVGGYWVEDAGGDVHDIFQFDLPVPMQVVGQAVQVVPVQLVATQG